VSARAISSESPHFTVVTYNVWNNARGRERAVVEVLRPLAADLIVLQEVYDRALPELLARELGLSYYFGASNTKRHGVVLSRLPILHTTTHRRFPPIRTGIVEVHLRRGSRPLRVFGVHLQPFLVHAFEYWRRWEIQELLAHAQSEPDLPTLIAGDFNATPRGARLPWRLFSPDIGLMMILQGGRAFHRAIPHLESAGFVDSYRALHADDGFTYRGPRPYFRIDYIFTNQGLAPALRECFVVRGPEADRASDHYPVVARFAF
jgi:exodeoxyribonuclease-3